MELSRSLLRSFARTVNDNSANKKVTNSMAGTVVMSNEKKYVKIDGSEALTPVYETVDIQEGDRVLVTIENHQASVIGNYTYPPSARTANSAYAMSEQNMIQVEHLNATSITTENLKAHSAEITNLVAENINAGYAKITELDAMHASIEELEANSITTETLEAEIAKIGYLSAAQIEAQYAKIEALEAEKARINTLEANSITTENLEAKIAEIGYLTADEIEAKYATIEELNATNGKITTLEGDYLEYKEATIDELEAHDASITNLSGEFASYKEVMAGELVTAKGWMLDGSIGNAQISSVDATKITSGILDTSLITVKGSDGKLQIVDNTMQITDASGVVRVQIGKDAEDDYSMSVWDQNGLLIWDALGATENTIQRKIIKDKMVADDAAIQALKIDFQSFETALTEQGVTISGTVVQVGDKTLNVYLTEKSEQIDEHSETLSDHSTRISANEESIEMRVTSQEYESFRDSMGSRMSDTESSIDILQEEINLKVEQAELEEAIDNIKIGGRNLIRNSNTLDFVNYYFGAYLMTSTDDGSGNVTIDYPPLDVTDDGNGNVTFEGVIATYNDSGNVTFTQQ